MATTDKVLAVLQSNPATFALDVEGRKVSGTLTARRSANSGSAGYGWQGKVEGADGSGRRYQVGINVTLIGSKPTA